MPQQEGSIPRTKESERRRRLAATRFQAAQMSTQSPSTRTARRIGSAAVGVAKKDAGVVKAGAQTAQIKATNGQGISKGVGGLSSAGKALTSTKIGSVIGAPMMTLGGAAQAATKTGEGASRSVDKGAESVSKTASSARNKTRDTQRMLDPEGALSLDDRDTSASKQWRQKNRRISSGGGELLGGFGKNTFGAGEMEIKRKTALMADRLPAAIRKRPGATNKKSLAMVGSPLGEIPRGSAKELSAKKPSVGQEITEQDQIALEQKRGAQNRASRFKRALVKRISRKEGPKKFDSLNAEKTGKFQNEIKKKAKAMFRRGAIFVVDMLAAALDLGSGFAFLIDIFVYAFTLGWLNLEMIYGRHMADGKSKLISPISWAPIPMPVDKKAIILQGFIVGADFAIMFAFAIFTIVPLLMVMAYIELNRNPIAFMTGETNNAIVNVIIQTIGQSLAG